jgi:hypothetical protein
MIAIAVKTLVEKQELREREKESIEKKIQEAMQLAADNVLEEKKGWSSGGEDSDGGAPEPPFKEEDKPAQSQNISPNTWSRGTSRNVSSANRVAALIEKSSWRSGDETQQTQKKSQRIT